MTFRKQKLPTKTISVADDEVVCNLAFKYKCNGKCHHSEKHEPTDFDTTKLCTNPVVCAVKRKVCFCS